MHVIYPSNPLRPKQPDEQFAAEAGDGRVLDLVGWAPGEFAEVLKGHFL